MQTSYNWSTAKANAGGIFDSYHYPIVTRINQENDGVLNAGYGVVKGTTAGKQVKLPTTSSVAADFEGIVVNDYTHEAMIIDKGHAVSVMPKGKVWVVLKEGETPAYGGQVYLCTGSGNLGKFSATSTDGVAINAKFIGGADNGLAPVDIDMVTEIQ